MSRGDNDIFSRWSRRKRAVAEEEAAQEPGRPARQAEADAPPEAAEEPLSEPELLEKLGLPDPDSLKTGDDFAAFMQEHVPEALRRRALRRLWSSDPVLANLDGLVDHGEDFTDAAMVPERLATVYKVGRGMLREALAAGEGRAEDEEAAAGAAPEAADIDDDATKPAKTGACEEKLASDAQPAAAGSEEEADVPPEPRPRRMTFRSG